MALFLLLANYYCFHHKKEFGVLEGKEVEEMSTSNYQYHLFAGAQLECCACRKIDMIFCKLIFLVGFSRCKVSASYIDTLQVAFSSIEFGEGNKDLWA